MHESRAPLLWYLNKVTQVSKVEFPHGPFWNKKYAPIKVWCLCAAPMNLTISWYHGLDYSPFIKMLYAPGLHRISAKHWGSRVHKDVLTGGLCRTRAVPETSGFITFAPYFQFPVNQIESDECLLEHGFWTWYRLITWYRLMYAHHTTSPLLQPFISLAAGHAGRDVISSFSDAIVARIHGNCSFWHYYPGMQRNTNSSLSHVSRRCIGQWSGRVSVLPK